MRLKIRRNGEFWKFLGIKQGRFKSISLGWVIESIVDAGVVVLATCSSDVSQPHATTTGQQAPATYTTYGWGYV